MGTHFLNEEKRNSNPLLHSGFSVHINYVLRTYCTDTHSYISGVMLLNRCVHTCTHKNVNLKMQIKCTHALTNDGIYFM